MVDSWCYSKKYLTPPTFIFTRFKLDTKIKYCSGIWDRIGQLSIYNINWWCGLVRDYLFSTNSPFPQMQHNKPLTTLSLFPWQMIRLALFFRTCLAAWTKSNQRHFLPYSKWKERVPLGQLLPKICYFVEQTPKWLFPE